MTKEENNSMLVFSSDWYGKGSFRMIPTSIECPYVEVIFDPSTKVLAIMGKIIKQKPQMLPKLNSKGQPVTVKSAEGTQGLAEERCVMEAYHEYYMDDKDDIKNFIKLFAFNPRHPALKILETIWKEEEKKPNT